MFEEYRGTCHVAVVLLSHSALAFHEITTHIPYEIYVPVSSGTTRPRLDHPPLRVFWFSHEAFTEEIETHIRDKVLVRVCSPETTLADCFKYRNKIGIDTVIEAVKRYKQKKSLRVEELLRFARVCRVMRLTKPYMEALL